MEEGAAANRLYANLFKSRWRDGFMAGFIVGASFALAVWMYAEWTRI